MQTKIRPLGLKSVTATMAVKCYSEQLISGADGLKRAIQAVSSDEFQMLVICHDKSAGKAHWHILVRAVDRNKKFQVKSMLKRLEIEFNEELDGALIDKRGIETVGEFTSYSTYLLHRTVEAKRDGKAEYDIKDIVSNLTIDEIQQILSGYIAKKRPIRRGELDALIDRARDAGRELKPFYEFIDSLNVLGMKDNEEKTLRKAYEAGVRRLSDENPSVERTFINIIGKDINALLNASLKALNDCKTLGLTKNMTYNIDTDVEAIVSTWDFDKIIKNESILLNDGIAEATGRVDVKGFWTGRYFVYISQISAENLFSQIRGITKCYTVDVAKDLVSKPNSYSDEEMVKVQELFDIFIEKFRENYYTI